MYKAVILFSIFCLTAFSTFGQKKVKCKSGQILELTSKGDLIKSNYGDLLANHSEKDTFWKQTYKELLNSELNNRIAYANKEVEITLLEYEKSRNKSEEKSYVSKILIAKKDLKNFDRSYEALNSDISKLMSKNRNDINAIIKKTLSVENENEIVVKESTEPVKVEIIEEQKLPEIKTIEDKPKPRTDKAKSNDKNNCQILFKGRNERTGKKQVVLSPDLMFTYTPEQMKNYFRLDNYLSGIFSFEKYDGKLIINAELRFNSKDVQKSYGSIAKKDFMRLDFINGKQVFLSATEVEDPYIESYTGNTIYKAKYELNDSADESTIKDHFIDKVGILWSSGYESYTIYKVDFMKEKMMCLDNAN